jgi:addiction module HigA family antidote
MAMMNPPHPGLSVKHDCLEPLGLSVTKGAEILGVTRQTLNDLVHGRRGISPEMALPLVGSNPTPFATSPIPPFSRVSVLRRTPAEGRRAVPVLLEYIVVRDHDSVLTRDVALGPCAASPILS